MKRQAAAARMPWTFSTCTHTHTHTHTHIDTHEHHKLIELNHTRVHPSRQRRSLPHVHVQTSPFPPLLLTCTGFLSTCISQIVVSSSTDNLVPRNSTIDLSLSQYCDWCRLPLKAIERTFFSTSHSVIFSTGMGLLTPRAAAW